MALREKIWNGEFVDFEKMLQADPTSESEQQSFVSEDGLLKAK
jgi:hypothetical protein